MTAAVAVTPPSTARVVDPAEALVVVTYNVHACVGLDGRVDVPRIAEVLAALRPDVIALQEVLGDAQIAEIAERLGLHAVMGTAFERTGGRYGNAVLSRTPILDSRTLDISVRGCEPRCLLHARIARGDTRLDVYNTHLGLRVRERQAQARACRAALTDVDDERPMLMMGDFNAWLPRGDALAALQSAFASHGAPRSYPGRRPVFALDRIWARHMRWLGDCRAFHSPTARVASDHLPVWARLRPA